MLKSTYRWFTPPTPAGIKLSFENSTYTIAEALFGQLVVKIVKEPREIARTEITYTMSIEATSTGGGTREAEEGIDFLIGGELIRRDIRPDDQFLNLLIQINDDDIPEGSESFQLVLSPIPNSQQFQNGMFSVATVTITDNDREWLCHKLESDNIIFSYI